MNGTHTTMTKKGSVQISDVAEPDNRLRVTPRRDEVDTAHNSVCAGPTPRRDDRPHTWIPNGLVQVVETFVIMARHKSIRRHCMRAYFNDKSPAFEDPTD